MYLEPDAKRLHRNDDLEPEVPPAGVANDDTFSNKSEVQEKGDPRLLDWVHFEHCAHETLSEEFCVPAKRNAKPKSMRRAKNEGNIKREDLEYFCSTILTQEERRGYWEIHPDQCTDEPTIIFEFETVAFVVQCKEKEFVKISVKDVAAILGPCLASNTEKPVVKKVTGTWSSYTDSGKVDFKWEIQGPKEGELDVLARTSLQQRAKSFFRARA